MFTLHGINMIKTGVITWNDVLGCVYSTIYFMRLCQLFLVNSWWAHWSLIISIWYVLSRFFSDYAFCLRHFTQRVTEVMLNTHRENAEWRWKRERKRVRENERQMQVTPSWTLVCGAAFKWTTFFPLPRFSNNFLFSHNSSLLETSSFALYAKVSSFSFFFLFFFC